VEEVLDVQRRLGNWTMENKENTRPFRVLFVASCPNAFDELNTSKDVIT